MRKRKKEEVRKSTTKITKLPSTINEGDFEQEVAPAPDSASSSNSMEEPEEDVRSAVEKNEIAVATYDDPGLWLDVLSNTMRKTIILSGPKQIFYFNFPHDDKGKKFSANYCKRHLKNELFHRNWLLYSKIPKDVVYCFCGKIVESQQFNSRM